MSRGTHPLTRKYHDWLCDQIRLPATGPGYSGVLLELYQYEFVWVVGNDENRIADALELRHEFVSVVQGTGRGVLNFPCSVLEVLVALSRRLEFNTGDPAQVWAWRLFVNLGLDKFPDRLSQEAKVGVRDICEALVWREYDRKGRGSFFPMQKSRKDQRKREIWQQMNDYLIENQMY